MIIGETVREISEDGEKQAKERDIDLMMATHTWMPTLVLAGSMCVYAMDKCSL